MLSVFCPFLVYYILLSPLIFESDVCVDYKIILSYVNDNYFLFQLYYEIDNMQFLFQINFDVDTMYCFFLKTL